MLKSFTLEYLLSYSHELYPDEYLNRNVKAGMAERALPADSKAVIDAVEERLSARKRTPEKVRNLFKKRKSAMRRRTSRARLANYHN